VPAKIQASRGLGHTTSKLEWWPLWFCLGEPVVLGEELQNLLAGGFGEFDDLDALRLVAPEPLERFDLIGHMLRLASPFPVAMDVKAFAVVDPPAPGLVDAAAEADSVARAVGNDADF